MSPAQLAHHFAIGSEAGLDEVRRESQDLVQRQGHLGLMDPGEIVHLRIVPPPNPTVKGASK